MKIYKAWTTHMPMLIKVVQMTDGPVMELGAGIFSTPLLHWLCVEKGRRLVTYEDHDKYIKIAKMFRGEGHEVYQVASYDDIDTKTFWDVVLVDHRADRREIDVLRLKNKANYIILHDTQSESYGYKNIWEHFKYVYHWKFMVPYTSVVSNFKNLSNL